MGPTPSSLYFMVISDVAKDFLGITSHFLGSHVLPFLSTPLNIVVCGTISFVLLFV